MPTTPVRRSCILVGLLFASRAPLAAQTTAAATVRGTVYDSLARAPLAGATVQLIPQDGAPGARAFVAQTDRSGAFRIDGVAAGRYAAGFFHPSLDSLGIETGARMLSVAAGDAARVELAIPSAATIGQAVCGNPGASDTTAMLLGFVRDARGDAPRAGADVTVQWSEMWLGVGGLRRELPEATVRTSDVGWFALCNVPAAVPLRLRAAAGTDSSGLIETTLSARTAHSIALVVGRSVVVHDSVRVASPEGDSVVIATTARRGPAALRGRVLAADGRPVRGAQVAIAGSASSARSNDDGAFALADLPAGSQMLDARALGFVPIRRPIELLDRAAPAEVTLTMTSTKAFLDTVRVTTTRLYTKDSNGFEKRRRSSGSGYFFDREALERRRAAFTSDILRLVPGVQVLPRNGNHVVVMRGRMGYCQPDIFVDGVWMFGPLQGAMAGSTTELDWWTDPETIDAMEVYPRGVSAPMQFNRSMGECGSVVIWTRPPRPAR